MDSREKLESDIRKWRYEYCFKKSNIIPIPIIFGWLDRMEQITREEGRKMASEEYNDISKRLDDLERRILFLEANRFKPCYPYYPNWPQWPVVTYTDKTIPYKIPGNITLPMNDQNKVRIGD